MKEIVNVDTWLDMDITEEDTGRLKMKFEWEHSLGNEHIMILGLMLPD